MRSVVIYPTPEVMDLIKLLRADATVEQYGDSGNVLVSAPEPKPFAQKDFDCKEGWQFVEYDAIYGTERYVAPAGVYPC